MGANKKRKNGDGSWGAKTINGYKYKYFRDPDGKYTYGKTEKEIREKLKNKDKTKINNDALFKTFLIWYLDTIHKNTVEITTYNAYKREAKTIIESKYYNIGNIKMKYFNKRNNHFQEYINAITPHYSRNSIKSQFTVLKIAAIYAEENELMEDGIIEKVKLPKEANVGKKVKEIPFFTKEIADKIYQEINQKYRNGLPKYNSTAWAVVLDMHTGLRVGELIALKWKNVDLQKKVIYVEESSAKIKDEVTNEYKNILKTTKNNFSKREVPLNSIAIEMINKFDAFTQPHKDTDRVCVNKNKCPMNRERIRQVLNRILRNINCDVQNVGIHTLRHTFGSLLYSEGVSLKDISKLLGHASITTTANIYIGITEEQLHQAVKKIE